MDKPLLALLTWLQRMLPEGYFLNVLLVRAICLNPAAGDPPTIRRLICSSILHELRILLGGDTQNVPPPGCSRPPEISSGQRQ